jgi:hypothetical protein
MANEEFFIFVTNQEDLTCIMAGFKFKSILPNIIGKICNFFLIVLSCAVTLVMHVGLLKFNSYIKYKKNISLVISVYFMCPFIEVFSNASP